MQIGVDGTCWSNERGYGRFAREILAAMVVLSPRDQFVCFVDGASAGRLASYPANVREILVRTKSSASLAASSSAYRSPRDILAMTRAVARESLDVFFSPSVYTYFPLPVGLPAVVTIHDAIAERFPQLTLPSRRARLFWKAKVWLALRQARRILTVSGFAAAEVERVHRVPRHRLDVALEAPSSAYRVRDAASVEIEAGKVGLSRQDRWFMYVGGFSPHKNVPSIIRAHASVAEQSSVNPPHLLLVGTLDNDVFLGDLAAIRGQIDASGTGGLVHWTGFLSDDRLSALHTGAIALLLPSAAEGFGLPAVEAAACGAPVIATTESPLPQLLEDGGLFVEPGNDSALAHAMLRLSSDGALRSSMGAHAMRRAAMLTWEAGAMSALASIHKAAR